MQASKSPGVFIIKGDYREIYIYLYGYLAAVTGSTWYLRAERGRYGVYLVTFQ